jgi:prepilin-type processing-associated H-X9-DG protein
MLSCNAAYVDGSVHQLKNNWLDPRVDGLTGGPEKPVADGISYMLQIKK